MDALHDASKAFILRVAAQLDALSQDGMAAAFEAPGLPKHGHPKDGVDMRRPAVTLQDLFLRSPQLRSGYSTFALKLPGHGQPVADAQQGGEQASENTDGEGDGDAGSPVGGVGAASAAAEPQELLAALEEWASYGQYKPTLPLMRRNVELANHLAFGWALLWFVRSRLTASGLIISPHALRACATAAHCEPLTVHTPTCMSHAGAGA